MFAEMEKRVVSLALLALGGLGCAEEPVPEGARADIAVGRPELVAAVEPAMRFVDVTQAAGLDFVHISGGPEQRYILEAMGSGSAFFDFDADGWLDFFAISGTRLRDAPESGNRLWRNLPSATGQRVFTEVTEEAGLRRVGWGMGAAVADYDNDGDLDLYVTHWGPNALYRNESDGTFSPVVTGVEDRRWGASAAFGDVDADGWQDLYVANYVAFDLDDPPSGGELCSGWKGLTVFCGPHGLDGQADVLYRNAGAARANGQHGGFIDMSAATGIDRTAYLGLGVLFTDYDQDGDADLYIANDSTPNQLYRNDGDWHLSEVGAFAGVAYSEEGRVQAGMGVDAGDYDNDGDEDIFVTNFSDDVNTLYRNQGHGSFADATHTAGLGGAARPLLGWSTALADFNLDGWLDIFVANGHLYPQLETHPLGLSYRQRNQLYWNRAGVFAPAAIAGLEAERVSRGAAFGDYDNDGDLDIVVNNLNDRPSLLRNDGGNRNHWLGLDLVGAQGRDAMGAVVRLWVGDRELRRRAKRGYGYLSSSDGRVLFGLGDATTVEKIEVRWPSGRIEVVERPQVGRYLLMREGSGAVVADYNNPVSVVPSVPEPVLQNPAERIPAVEPKPGWTPSMYYERASALYAQGRYRETLALLRPVLARYPRETQLHYIAGVVLYSGLGRYAEAVEVLERAVVQDASGIEVMQLLGVIYLQLNEPDKAVTVLESVRVLVPEDWQTLFRLGLAHNRLGADTAAIAAFERARELAPDEPMPHLHLARMHKRLGREMAAQQALQRFEILQPLQQQIDHYRQAVEANPQRSASHAKLGLALAEAGRLAAAEQAFSRSLALDPVAETRTNLANVLLRQGEVEAALGHFAQALVDDPNLAEARYGLGMAYYAKGEAVQALRALEDALEFRPNFAKAHINIGVILAEQHRPQEALHHFRRAVDLDPDDARAGNNFVTGLARAGRIDEARQAFARAAARQVALPLARKILVMALLQVAQVQAGEGALSVASLRQRQAIELTPPQLRKPLVEQLKIYEAGLQK